MQTRERCQRLCSLLQRVLPLVREHPVDFFVSNLWEVAVPADWRAELCEMSVQELAMLGGTAGVRAGSYDDSIAAERSNEAELRARNTTTDAETSHADQEGSLAAFLRELHEATVARALTETKEPAETSSSSASSLLYTSSLHSASPSESKKPPQSGSNYRALSVSDKKAHEVPRMAEEVQRLAARHAVSCVVDLGSGKGYLAEELARRGVKVVGIDCNPDNARGAERRHRLLVNPKLLHAGRSKTERAEAKRIQNDGRPPFSPPLDDPAGDGGGDDGDAPRGEAYSRGELPFHMITGRVEGKDSAALGRFLEERTLGAVTASERLMLVGLHACGDLTATLLRCFVACDNVRSVMVVGCCYHRLTETRACSTPAFESASPPPAPLPAPPYPPSGMVNDVSDVALADDEEGPTREREDESAAASWEVERDGVREAPATRDECVGFPMSRWVRDRLPSWLGKSALTLAGHSTVDRIAAGRGTDSLYHATFCRAVFQVRRAHLDCQHPGPLAANHNTKLL